MERKNSTSVYSEDSDITSGSLYDIIDVTPFNNYQDKDDVIQFLRKENTRLNNLVDKHKNIANEIWNRMFDVVRQEVSQITVKPPKDKGVKRGKRPELVCNPWNADTQLGKKTPTYNSDVAAERVELYTDKIIDYTDIFSSGGWDVRTAHVYFLGDIVEGEGIFPTQPYTLDSSLYEQVCKNGPSIYGSQLRRLLEVFDHVHVAACIGNHGNLTRYNNPETNMDRMLYKILQHMFAEEPRISFDIPDGNGERMFWVVDSIGDYSTLLVHGDQFPPPMSAHQYLKKILGWKTSGITAKFDDVAMGHYHQNTKFTFGQTVVRVSGSTESHNTFAQERLGVMGRPSQHMQMVDPNSGVFWESDVFLD